MSNQLPKRHLRSQRLLVNTGMSFPACYANAKLLDLDKSRLRVTSDKSLVTCMRCRKMKVMTHGT